MGCALNIIDVGRCAYGETLDLQKETLEARRREQVPDTLILVEHDPVYTLGRAADSSNILVSAEELAQRGISVAETGRGGDVTYHGPGQLVCYPIISLDRRKKGPVWYVSSLERVLIETLARWGVAGTTDPKNRGVWVGDEKIAAIGVRITRRITMHGFALNVRTNMDHYEWMIPCGIRGKGVTSLHLLVPEIRMEDVKRRVVERFMDVFGYEKA